MLRDYFNQQTEAMVELLTEIVNYETFTAEKSHVDKLADFLMTYCEGQGASSVERIPMDEVGDIVLAKWNESAPGKPVLFLTHIDTVHPSGSLAQRPVRNDGEGRLYGPGALDMKAGGVIGLTAIRGLRELDQLPQRPIWFLFTTDEETGSKHSAPVIRELAAQSGLVLVLEPGTKDDALKVQRKGIATYRIHVQGRASHAGNSPEEGVNAIVELAQQIMKVNQLNDLRNGTSVSVTMTQGGTAGNVIPAYASAYVDTRVVTQRAMDALQAGMGNLQPHIPGATVTLEQIHARPPMEFNDLMRQTFEQAQAIGKAHGITVRGDSVGGGSDGNITAAMGIPTLDGLGAIGDGLHADHEHVLISSLPRKAALVAAILTDWQYADS